MIDGVAVQQEMVGDDAPVASPPDGFRAHQGQASVGAEGDNLIERGGECLAQGVIGIILETLHPPHGIEVGIDTGLLRPAPAQRGIMPVSDLNLCEIGRQSIDVEDRVASRPRKRSDIDQQIDTSLTQHADEFFKAAI